MIKESCVVALGLLLAVALRKQSAALRHLVLATAIISAAAMPALERMAPSWELPFGGAVFARTAPLALLAPLDLQPDRTVPASANVARGVERGTTWWARVRALWLGGVAVSLLVLLVGLGRLAWLAARSRAVRSGVWRDVATELSEVYDLSRPVLLLQSTHPALLVTWGLRRPTVMLPSSAHEWSEARIRSVLAHELAHIVRRDWLTHMASELLRSVYWFNPLVWIACGRLRQESELACDDAVLGLGIAGTDYATHLLDLARAFRGYRTVGIPAPAMARRSHLERRVSAMLNSHLKRTPTTRVAAFAVTTGLVAVALVIASLVASAQATTASFSGTLLDAVGRVLPASTLTLSNVATNEKREATSEQSGAFAFANLPAGEYQIQTSTMGFERAQGRLVVVGGQTLKRDIALQIGSLEETMTVSAADAPRAASVRTNEQPSFDPCSQSATGGCITPPTPLVHAMPGYPPALRDNPVTANVKVSARIGTDGLLKDFRVTAPADAPFIDATMDALRRWQFSTVRLDGVPVEANIQITTHFVAP